MSRIDDHLADLTGYRDRDVLDTTLVTVLRDLLRPRSIAICHTVGEAPTQRWLVRARLSRDDIAAQADPSFNDPDAAPLLEAFPERLACLQQQESIEVPFDGHHMTYFPLLTDRDIVGVLEVESDDELDADQLRAVSSMLRVYRNVQGLLDYSERDSLTGLLNRKTFDDTFHKIAILAATAPAPSAERREGGHAERRVYLGVIDVDKFKSVNDQYGHLIGDEVLLLLSRLMRASFRYTDRLFRFGGEEFVVLLRAASDDEAAEAFERLRRATEGYTFPLVGRVTVSVGFTCVRVGDNPSAAFERADKAVYWAKQNGRNRVADHTQLVAQGQLVEEERGGGVEYF